MKNYDIANIIKESNNRYEILKKLNWDLNTTGYKKLNEFITNNNIDISHFETRKDVYNRTLIYKKNFIKISLNDILIENSTYKSTNNLKLRLYKEGLKRPICEKCGQNENWHNEHISMILDHINGINNDNRLENLRILCPNCNATLPTHCGKNSKKNKHKYYCKCGKEIYKTSKSCMMCDKINKRKIERPSLEQLKLDVNELGYRGTGKKYGVSDNSIRKWMKNN